MKLSNALFWDTDAGTLDYERHAAYIIGRVLERGTLDEWREIKAYYGLERIKQETLKARYLSKSVLSFCSNLFEIPVEKFRSYQWQMALPEAMRWDY
jgi:hypothetical protein